MSSRFSRLIKNSPPVLSSLDSQSSEHSAVASSSSPSQEVSSTEKSKKSRFFASKILQSQAVATLKVDDAPQDTASKTDSLQPTVNESQLFQVPIESNSQSLQLPIESNSQYLQKSRINSFRLLTQKNLVQESVNNSQESVTLQENSNSQNIAITQESVTTQHNQTEVAHKQVFSRRLTIDKTLEKPSLPVSAYLRRRVLEGSTQSVNTESSVTNSDTTVPIESSGSTLNSASTPMESSTSTPTLNSTLSSTSTPTLNSSSTLDSKKSSSLRLLQQSRQRQDALAAHIVQNPNQEPLVQVVSNVIHSTNSRVFVPQQRLDKKLVGATDGMGEYIYDTMSSSQQKPKFNVMQYVKEFCCAPRKCSCGCGETLPDSSSPGVPRAVRYEQTQGRYILSGGYMKWSHVIAHIRKESDADITIAKQISVLQMFADAVYRQNIYKDLKPVIVHELPCVPQLIMSTDHIPKESTLFSLDFSNEPKESDPRWNSMLRAPQFTQSPLYKLMDPRKKENSKIRPPNQRQQQQRSDEEEDEAPKKKKKK